MSVSHVRVILPVLFAAALGYASLSPAPAATAPPLRGEMVDIGGRRMHLVCVGPRGQGPTVLFEAGAFGTSADWAVVQSRISDRYHSCAYDRAGLGMSDPGPKPRDSEAIVSDLEKLLAAAGEPGPYILVAHSMAPVHAYLFARRHPHEVVGLVLVDATPPEVMTDPKVEARVRRFERISAIAAVTARLGVNALLSGSELGDPIGLPEPVQAEKRQDFASATHNRWSALEAENWLKDGEEARAAGDLDPEVPVAVVTAGSGRAAWQALQAEPARRSRFGVYENVPEAAHASLLGPKYCDAIVRAIDYVNRVATERRG